MTTYAVADKVPEGCDYLTVGKEYEAIKPMEFYFMFDDDAGDRRNGKWRTDGCHLNGGNWRRVEK